MHWVQFVSNGCQTDNFTSSSKGNCIWKKSIFIFLNLSPSSTSLKILFVFIYNLKYICAGDYNPKSTVCCRIFLLQEEYALLAFTSFAWHSHILLEVALPFKKNTTDLDWGVNIHLPLSGVDFGWYLPLYFSFWPPSPPGLWFEDFELMAVAFWT